MPDPSEQNPGSLPSAPGADAPPAGLPPAPEDHGRSALTVFVLMICLAVGGWFLVQKLLEMTQLQNCVMSGRKNCYPIDPNAQGSP